jgi:hypothetical protein
MQMSACTEIFKLRSPKAHYACSEGSECALRSNQHRNVYVCSGRSKSAEHGFASYCYACMHESFQVCLKAELTSAETNQTDIHCCVLALPILQARSVGTDLENLISGCMSFIESHLNTSSSAIIIKMIFASCESRPCAWTACLHHSVPVSCKALFCEHVVYARTHNLGGMLFSLHN